ncbi:MAG: GatB/YqeY domain-containing protein [Candidatus Magasanikbacteria bacterium]|nr:GatB/YqeY domain-containing protein [Candidatus Magasanikbacteria bacterium]
MSLYQKILGDLAEAMKAKQADRLSVLRMLKTAVENERIAQMKRDTDPDDAFVMAVLKRYKKQQEDALADFERGGRQDAVEKTKAEIGQVSGYLPAEMDDAAIDAMVQDVLKEMPEPRDFGRVMGAVVKKVAGGADGGRVKARVEAALK